MKVSTIKTKAALSGSTGIKGASEKNKDFSQSFDNANKDLAEQRLKDMLKDIEHFGRRLISTRSVADAREYKTKVKEYMSYVIKNMYVLKTEYGPYNYGVYTKIELIDKKLDDLTQRLLEEQFETIELADSIEELKGLLIDIYK